MNLLRLLVETLLSIVAWAAIGVLTLFWAGLIFADYLGHPLWDPQLKAAHRLACLWGRSLVSMVPGLRIKIFGQGHLPSGRPVILMANHQSYSDIPVLYSLKGQFKWMADQALFNIPFFGWAMRLAGYVPVTRGDAHRSLSSLEEAKRWLQRGISIFVFPEGTRSHTGGFGRFQTGGFRLAVSTGTPIVPVVLVGTRQLLPRGSWIFQLGARPEIHLLPAVIPASTDLKQVRPLARQVRAQMARVYRQRLKELKG